MENVKENIQQTIKVKTDGYREGAIAGGLVGFVIAAYLRKNILVGAVIGMVGGGYIGYIARQEKDLKFEQQ